jgi:hypothetical protein
MNANNVVVQAVGTKEVKTRFGVKPTYSFKASDGNWYKTGFKEEVRVGDCISFDYMPGTYGNEVNVKTIVKGAAAPAATPTPAAHKQETKVYPIGNKGVFPIPALDGQRSIVRQNALTNARELFVGTMPPIVATATKKELEMMAQRIIGVAKIFEGYTAGDTDLEEVEAEIVAAEKKAA